MTTDNPVPQTPEDLLFARIRSAMHVSPEERVLAGFAQSELAMRVVEDGIRQQNPDADDATVKRLLIERVDLMRKFEQPSGSAR